MTALLLFFGLFYLFGGLVASYVLRTANAPLFVKVAVPAALVALACVTWKTLPQLFGYPVETAFAALPQQAELIAFVPHEEEKTVDVWLIADGLRQPRAYSVPLTDDLKDTLKKAQKQAADGGRAVLRKKDKGKPNHPAYTDKDGGEAPYELLPEAFSLPKKAEQ